MKVTTAGGMPVILISIYSINMHNTKQQLIQTGLYPKKKLGQNFLIDTDIVPRVLSAAALNSIDTIVEIGAGTGALTREIAPIVSRLIALEFDRDLIPLLKKNTDTYNNVEIVNENALDFRPSDYALDDLRYKIIGAIPYNITSPLLHHVMNVVSKPSTIVLIIQREVADKLTAMVPDATYLSTFFGTFAEIEIVKIIKPGSFYPAPSVDSALITINLHNPQPDIDIPQWQKFLHHGFMQPRKMINKRFEKDVLEKAGIDSNRRAQTLTGKEWRALYYALNMKV